jgi:hypothetical protein
VPECGVEHRLKLGAYGIGIVGGAEPQFNEDRLAVIDCQHQDRVDKAGSLQAWCYLRLLPVTVCGGAGIAVNCVGR